MIELLIALSAAFNIGVLVCLILAFRSLRRELFNIKQLLQPGNDGSMLNSPVQSSTSRLNVQHETLQGKIQSLRLQGYSYAKIAESLGISKALVHYYLKKKR